MTYSEKIKNARERAGLSQQELADQIGVGKRTIASYENGKTRPRSATLDKLAEALKVSVMELTDDSAPAAPKASEAIQPQAPADLPARSVSEETDTGPSNARAALREQLRKELQEEVDRAEAQIEPLKTTAEYGRGTSAENAKTQISILRKSVEWHQRMLSKYL